MNDVTEKSTGSGEGGALEPVAQTPPVAQPVEPPAPPARPAPPPRPAKPARPEMTTSAPPSVQAEMDRPRAISVSWILWMTGCLAAMLTGVLAIFDRDDLKADLLVKIVKEYPDESATTQEDLAEAALGGLIGVGVLLALACMFFAVMMHGRRNWGRICLVVFGPLTVLYALVVSTWAPGDIAAGLIITAALMVVASVLMYLPSNKEWYRLLKLYRTDENTKVF